jgi:hypothetical protein
MIHSESSSDLHEREDGRRRANTITVGWRLGRDIVSEVLALAEETGTRPGRLVAGILREQIALMRRPIDSVELETRMLRARFDRRD